MIRLHLMVSVLLVNRLLQLQVKHTLWASNQTHAAHERLQCFSQPTSLITYGRRHERKVVYILQFSNSVTSFPSCHSQTLAQEFDQSLCHVTHGDQCGKDKSDGGVQISG